MFSATKFSMLAGMASLMLQSQVMFTPLFAMTWLEERWQPYHRVVDCAGENPRERHDELLPICAISLT